MSQGCRALIARRRWRELRNQIRSGRCRRGCGCCPSTRWRDGRSLESRARCVRRLFAAVSRLSLQRQPRRHFDRRLARQRLGVDDCGADSAHFLPAASDRADRDRRYLFRGAVRWFDNGDPAQRAKRETSPIVPCLGGHQMATKGRAGLALAVADVAQQQQGDLLARKLATVIQRSI
jgi:hypothetical protein